MSWRLLGFLLVLWVAFSNAALHPEVILETGTLRGVIQQSTSGKDFSAFLGVPYAKPPVGKHRFKESISPNPWLGIFNATSLPPVCLQYSQLTYDLLGSEDCLYLNVYTPNIDGGKVKGSRLLDVLVFFHGGAFMFYSSNYFGPEFLLDKDIVYVSVNYRLGPLGFFTTGDSLVPGNNGMRDQVMALRWVQKNIAAFGGNPSSVTIAGMSAGGASVHYHMISPMSKGLFHKAISMSGVSLNPWAHAENLTEKSAQLSASMGCDFQDPNIVLRCLRSRPAEKIVEYSKLMQGWRYYPFSPWAPSVEPTGTISPFLPSQVLDIISSGQASDVPWLCSFTNLEGLYPAAEFIINEQEVQELESKWNDYIPLLCDFLYTAPEGKLEEISMKIRDEYLKGKTLSGWKERMEFVEILSDRLFVAGIAEAILEHARFYKSPIYSYLFSFKGSSSVAHLFCNCDHPFEGACHADDTAYIFKTKTAITTDAEKQLSKQMVDMWYNFMTTGTPHFGGKAWSSAQEGLPDLTYLHIRGADDSVLVTEKNTGRGSFWRSLNLKENHISVLPSKDEL